MEPKFTLKHQTGCSTRFSPPPFKNSFNQARDLFTFKHPVNSLLWLRIISLTAFQFTSQQISWQISLRMIIVIYFQFNSISLDTIVKPLNEH